MRHKAGVRGRDGERNVWYFLRCVLKSNNLTKISQINGLSTRLANTIHGFFLRILLICILTDVASSISMSLKAAIHKAICCLVHDTMLCCCRKMLLTNRLLLCSSAQQIPWRAKKPTVSWCQWRHSGWYTYYTYTILSAIKFKSSSSWCRPERRQTRERAVPRRKVKAIKFKSSSKVKAFICRKFWYLYAFSMRIACIVGKLLVFHG